MVGRWPKVLSNSAHFLNTVEFEDVVRSRRMTRSFLSRQVPREVIHHCVDLASRSPSAGKTQGWNLLLLENEEVMQYWDIALPESQRSSFSFPNLLRAPVLLLSMADRQAYLDRYSQPDKSHTDLGEGESRWPAPYWTIDASFATMTLLHALHNSGLSALFFAHAQEALVREKFAIPDHVDVLGVIATGYADRVNTKPGRSATQRRRTVDEIIHHQQW